MLNRAEVIGYLGNDPAVKYTQAGECIAEISVATTEKWKDRSGERQERTEWHRITFFGKLAEVVGEYLKKGKLVFVAGRIQTDKYTDKDGIERYSTKIIGNEMKMLGGRDDRESGQRQSGDQRQTSGRQQPQRQPAQRQAPRQQTMDDDFSDDDIPF